MYMRAYSTILSTGNYLKYMHRETDVLVVLLK